MDGQIKQILHTKEDILEVLCHMLSSNHFGSIKCIGLEGMTITLVNNMDSARERVISLERIDLDWLDWFTKIGSLVLRMLEHFTVEEEEKFAAFLLNKHHEYGAEPLLIWKQLGILMRLQAKVSRYFNLTLNKHRQQVQDESTRDTLKDILGYCILGYKLTELNL